MAHQQQSEISLSSCKFESRNIPVFPLKAWIDYERTTTTTTISEEESSLDSAACTISEAGKTIRIHSDSNSRAGKNFYNNSPSYFRWNPHHFHEGLQVISGKNDTNGINNSTSGEGMVVLFQAMASEGITVALSPKPYFQLGKTYEIYLGIDGNTKAKLVLKRKQPPKKQRPKQLFSYNSNPNLEISVPTRLCCTTGAPTTKETYVSFWIVLHQDVLYAGLGNVPGQQCIMVLNIKEQIDRHHHQQQDQKQKDERDNKDQNNDTKQNKASINNSNDTDDQNENKNHEEERKRDREKDTDAPKQPAEESATKTATAIKTTTISDGDAAISPQYVGFGNWSKPQERRLLKIRNIMITKQVPVFLREQLRKIDKGTILDPLSLQPGLIFSKEEEEFFKQYQEECKKAKVRAEKFGIPYKEPSLSKVVPWTVAKKIQSNPERGFVTGIDLFDPQELEKQQKRKERFGVTKSTDKGDDQHNDNSEDSADANDNKKNGEKDKKKKEGEELSFHQAWDNEYFVKHLRKDLPSHLWMSKQGESPSEKNAERIDVIEDEEDKKAIFSPERIHIFSIDWAAFKQIRNDDIMSYFNMYGPSYVEWLGELSCNVVFEDKYSATRALQCLSQQLPSPPSVPLEEDISSGKKINNHTNNNSNEDGVEGNDDDKKNDNNSENSTKEEKTDNKKLKEKNENNGDNDNGNSNNKDGKDGHSDNNDDGNDNDNNNENTTEKRKDTGNNDDKDVESSNNVHDNNNNNKNVDTVERKDDGDHHRDNSSSNKKLKKTQPSDLGKMGWRFCLTPIRKVKDDRFGRRGTTARFLVRAASSLDILVKRPSSWPKPPPGFTTKRILGPGSDHYRNSNLKNKNKNRPSSSVYGGKNCNDRSQNEEDPLFSSYSHQKKSRGGSGNHINNSISNKKQKSNNYDSIYDGRKRRPSWKKEESFRPQKKKQRRSSNGKGEGNHNGAKESVTSLLSRGLSSSR